MHIKLIAFNARYIHSCPALFYVRNELARNLPGCQVRILQFTISDPYYKSLLHIIREGPQGLFFSVYIWNSHFISRLLPDIVKVLPQVRIVLGGPQAPALLKELLSSGPDLAANCCVVVGEVEGLPKSFYEDVRQGHLHGEYRAATGSRFDAPYRKRDFEEELRNRHIYYESARGCVFNCTYCLSSKEKGVRHKSIDRVREELAMICAENPRVVRFVDRTFNDRPDRALAIWRFLVELGSDVLFHFEMIPDRITGEMFSFLETLPQGRFQFEMGVQTTHAPSLGAVDRRMDLVKVRENIRRLADLETIHLHVDLILGLPHETPESFKRSFDDIFSLNPHYIQMGLLKVLPDTPISEATMEFGLVVCKSPPYEILATRWISHAKLTELYWFGECVEAFHNNRYFRSIWSYIRNSGERPSAFFMTLLKVCMHHDFFRQAATQELMSSILLQLIIRRKDKDLLTELLVYDWLRSGCSHIPKHLRAVTPELSKTRTEVRRRWPPNWEDVYDYQDREIYFRQTVFVWLSELAVKELCLSKNGKGGWVCFENQREETVFKHRKTRFVPDDVCER